MKRDQLLPGCHRKTNQLWASVSTNLETRRMAAWITMGSDQLFTCLKQMLDTSEQERELRWAAQNPLGVAGPLNAPGP